SRMLTVAVEEAYHSLLLSGRHPIAVVNIQLDPALLDVNVHPAKTEIRFLKERRVYSAVQRAVRGALLQGAEMPQWRGQGEHHPKSEQPATSTHEQEEDTELADLLGGEPGVVAPLAGTLSGGQVTSESQLPQDNPWLTVTEEETGTKPPTSSR